MKNKKVLFVATVVKKHINVFHLPYLQWFQGQGYETHVAARDDFNGEECIIPHCDKHFDILFERSPLNKNNIKAYRQLKKIINENNYEIIHCHTPVAAMLTRLAARKARRIGTKVIYTAHGFHFFKGAPIVNWMLYFPVEKWLSKYTDILITINTEDYNRAKTFRAKRVELVNGVGVDLERFHQIDYAQKKELREKMGYSENQLILIYPAELNKNKNQQMLLKSLYYIKKEYDNVKLLLPGKGDNLERLKKITSELNLQGNVEFLGFRDDINDLIAISDIAVASSIREGLGLNVIESLASGLPVIATANRGHKELIRDSFNGYLIKINDSKKMANKILEIYNDKEKMKKMSKNSLNSSLQYSKNNILDKMRTLYLD